MLTVPAAAGSTKRQIKFMTDFGTTVVHAIPELCHAHLRNHAAEGLTQSRDTRLKILAIGAEP